MNIRSWLTLLFVGTNIITALPETFSTALSESSSTTTTIADDIIKPTAITEAINNYNNHDNNDSYRTIIKTINNNYNNYEKPSFSSFTQYPTSSTPQMQRPIMQSTASPSSPLVDRIIEDPSVNSNLLSYSRLINVNSNVNRYSLDRRQQRAVPPEYSEMPPQCETFVTGDPEKKTLYSPNYPNNYPNNTDCVLVLEAPPGFLIRLDFRDHFNIEPSEDCKYDYLEIRDGAHGFSTLLGQFCGQDQFPPMVTSRDRYLWLHFHADENIEYKGFVAVYDYVPRPTTSIYDDESCRMEVTGMEGFVNRSDVPKEKDRTVVEYNLALDCMWVITVMDGWKIQLSFTTFKLERPNDCESNFVDVFTERTDLPSRLKNFCGSIADSVVSKSNILHIRFFAEAAAINSTFSILFTAFREKTTGEACEDDEYDCEDATCISADLRCNGRINCRFRWDEDESECNNQIKPQSEHVVIIVCVFGLILGGMLAIFLVNCIRKIVRDHKIIRENIRQSRESKLDELGRHSTKKRVDLDITKFPPPEFDKISPTNVNILDNMYYREVIPMPPDVEGGGRGEGNNIGGGISSVSNNRIDNEMDNRNQQEYQDDRSISKEAEMCDMACQTRESLFQPVFKNKVTQSPNQMTNSLRFSTFGYNAPQQIQIPAETPPPPKVKHHHHHHHHHLHHIQDPNSTLPKMKASTAIEMDDLGAINDNTTQTGDDGSGGGGLFGDLKTKRFILKKDDLTQRSFGSDIRKSAPDVIIMTSSH